MGQVTLSFAADTRLHITRSPDMLGVVWVTLGPKRPCRYKRLKNGVTILLDPVSYEPFGFMLIEGRMTTSVLVLPITGTLTPLIPQ
jgi:hypothetical protein